MERRREHISFNEVQRYIQECKYPCSKEELVSCARDHEAPIEVIQTLEVLKPETKFSDLNVVRENVEKASM